MELSVNFNFARDFFPGVFDENYLVFFDLLFQVNEGFVFYEKTDSGLVIDALQIDLRVDQFELVLFVLILLLLLVIPVLKIRLKIKVKTENGLTPCLTCVTIPTKVAF